MVIDVPNFGSSIFRFDPRLLPNNIAQVAVDVDTTTGVLSPVNGFGAGVDTVSADPPNTIYLHGSTWYSWSDAFISVVPAQIYGRDGLIMWTGDDYPKQTTMTDGLAGASRLGVTKPLVAPEVLPTGTEDTEKASTDISYCFTYVTEFGEESAPSPISGIATILGGQYVTLKGLYVPPTKEECGNTIEYVRFYRLVTSASGASNYYLVPIRPGSDSAEAVTDVPADGITGVDYTFFDSNSSTSPSGLNQNISETLPSETWEAPPDELLGLVQFQNGILAGFYKNKVYISEPNILYAFPDAYQQEFDSDVVALGTYKGSLVVLTESNPCIIQGTHPENMVKVKLPYKQKCMSPLAVVSTEMGVIYPSPDGVMLLNDQGITNLTDPIYTKEQWGAMDLENLSGVYFENDYYGFYRDTVATTVLTGATFKGAFRLTLGNPPTFTHFTMPYKVHGLFVDPSANILYFTQYRSGAYYVDVFKGGDPGTLVWYSKVFDLPFHTNFGCYKIEGTQTESSPILISLFFDGAPSYTTISSTDVFRMPSNKLYKTFYFALATKSSIFRVRFAHTPEELIDG